MPLPAGPSHLQSRRSAKQIPPEDLGKEAWEERKGPGLLSLSCSILSRLLPPQSARSNESEAQPLRRASSEGRLLRLQKPDGQASPSGREADVGLCSRNAAFPGPAAEGCRLDGETVLGGRGACKRRETVPEITSGATPGKLLPRSPGRRRGARLLTDGAEKCS